MQLFELSGWKIMYVKRAILIVQSVVMQDSLWHRKHPGAAHKVCLLSEAGSMEDVAEVHSLDSTAYLGTPGCNKKSLMAKYYSEDRVPHKLGISAGSQRVNFPWAGNLKGKNITSAACVWTMTEVLFRTRNTPEFSFEYYLGDKGDEWIAAQRYTLISEFLIDGF